MNVTATSTNLPAAASSHASFLSDVPGSVAGMGLSASIFAAELMRILAQDHGFQDRGEKVASGESLVLSQDGSGLQAAITGEHVTSAMAEAMRQVAHEGREPVLAESRGATTTLHAMPNDALVNDASKPTIIVQAAFVGPTTVSHAAAQSAAGASTAVGVHEASPQLAAQEATQHVSAMSVEAAASPQSAVAPAPAPSSAPSAGAASANMGSTAAISQPTVTATEAGSSVAGSSNAGSAAMTTGLKATAVVDMSWLLSQVVGTITSSVKSAATAVTGTAMADKISGNVASASKSGDATHTDVKSATPDGSAGADAASQSLSSAGLGTSHPSSAFSPIAETNVSKVASGVHSDAGIAAGDVASSGNLDAAPAATSGQGHPVTLSDGGGVAAADVVLGGAGVAGNTTAPNSPNGVVTPVVASAPDVHIDASGHTVGLLAGQSDIVHYVADSSLTVEGFILGEDHLVFADGPNNSIGQKAWVDGNDLVLGDDGHGTIRLIGVMADSAFFATHGATAIAA